MIEELPSCKPRPCAKMATFSTRNWRREWLFSNLATVVAQVQSRPLTLFVFRHILQVYTPPMSDLRYMLCAWFYNAMQLFPLCAQPVRRVRRKIVPNTFGRLSGGDSFYARESRQLHNYIPFVFICNRIPERPTCTRRWYIPYVPLGDVVTLVQPCTPSVFIRVLNRHTLPLSETRYRLCAWFYKVMRPFPLCVSLTYHAEKVVHPLHITKSRHTYRYVPKRCAPMRVATQRGQNIKAELHKYLCQTVNVDTPEPAARAEMLKYLLGYMSGGYRHTVHRQN